MACKAIKSKHITFGGIFNSRLYSKIVPDMISTTPFNHFLPHVISLIELSVKQHLKHTVA